jgi:transcriptional regulator with XRE-family HTH domain
MNIGSELRIGPNITKLRTTLGWTQSKLAWKVGVPVSVISHYETNRRTPNVHNLIMIALAFDVTLDALVE